MAAKSRFFRHTILWAMIAPILLLFVVPLVSGPQGYGPSQQEISGAERIFGRETHARLMKEAERTFSGLFIESGMVAWTMNAFTASGGAGFGFEGGYRSASSRWIEGFWLSVWQGVYRARLALTWFPAIAAAMAASFADGLAVRAIRRAGWGYNNPYAFHLATHAVIALFGLSLALLFAPVSVHPVVFPVIATLACIAAWQAACNFQTGA
ncbi:MAG: hypothetical protein DI596_00560 [Azospira oryzae]|nr:MAG: hypothetical protein DI596_00560 [Azospira oryzae]PZP82947.1 MAG: hypothetical protein DI593_00560 [Azospira oryzae]